MLRWLLHPKCWYLAGALLVVVGAKLWLVRSFGSDVPYADQWAGEGASIFQMRMRYGHVPGHHFFFSHGEHRPATMRLWTYGLFLANGDQWDARLECFGNVLFQAATCLLLWWLAGALLPGWRLGIGRVVAVLICAMPCNFENFVWGFQSQFLLLILGGLFHVAGTMTAARPGSRWWLAQIGGLIAILSLSSGMMSAVALCLMGLWEAALGRRDAWMWATTAVNLALSIFGFWFLHPLVSAADHVHSAWQFVRDMLDLLAWPCVKGRWGLFSQIPLAAMAVLACRRGEAGRVPRLLLTLEIWLLGLMAALAVGRGGNPVGMFIATRYQDILVLGCWGNVLAVLWLSQSAGTGRRRLWGFVLPLSLIPMVLGLLQLNAPEHFRTYAQIQKDYIARHDATVREFLQSNNPAVFERDPVIRSAFPHLNFTIELLRDPQMRPALPPSLQPDGRSGPLSRIAMAAVQSAPSILLSGCTFALGAIGLQLWRRRKKSD